MFGGEYFGGIYFGGITGEDIAIVVPDRTTVRGVLVGPVAKACGVEFGLVSMARAVRMTVPATVRRVKVD
jgi:hypothetical protein